MGGINSALINLCYDYVALEKRADALAISLAISGVCGFLATLAASALVEYVEQNSNRLWGFHVYPQQILFAVSAVMLLALALLFLPRLKNPNRVSKS